MSYRNLLERHLLSRKWIGEPGNENRRQNRGLDPDVVVRVDADVLLLGVERVLAERLGLELVVSLEVRPAPDAAVDHVR